MKVNYTKLLLNRGQMIPGGYPSQNPLSMWHFSGEEPRGGETVNEYYSKLFMESPR